MVENEDGYLTFFAVNKKEEACDLECVLGGFDGYQVDTHIVLSHEDLFAANTVDNQDNVVPHTVETSKSKTMC